MDSELEKETDEDETENDQSTVQKKRAISSYGISIDTNDIQPVDSAIEDRSELERLGISAYEQDQFEKDIIDQVDSQISEAELNFQRNAIKKDIENLESEIRNAEIEIKDIEQIFTCAKEGDPTYTRRVSFSLLQKKQSKETSLKQLRKQLQEQLLHLEDLNENPQHHHTDTANQQEDLIKLGEITPFDALSITQSGKSFAQKEKHNAGSTPVNSKTKSSSNNNVERHTGEDDSVIDSSAETEIGQVLGNKQPTNSLKRKSTNVLDDEYVPTLSSTDEEEYDNTHEAALDDSSSKKKKKTLSKNVKKSKKRSAKITDDGDFASYKERISKLKVKNRLKEASKNGEVAEEYDPADFSDSTDEEQPEMNVDEDFMLKKKIWNKLFRYQRVGVKWLWQLHKQQVGGIIGDEMGLGKTIQMIAFLVGLKNRKSAHGGNPLGPVLIVCPATVLHQWVAEFHKWAPDFRVAILHDSGTFHGRKATLIKAINKEPGVLVTTYAGVRLNREELYRYYWNYVILDEGHKIRNPDSDVTLAVKQFDTPHRIILTGTPMQNSLKELWSLFDFVYPGRLGTLPVFMAEFSVPITMGGYANVSSVQVQTAHRCASVLRDTIKPYMMRRMKKDVQMVIELPQKSEQVLFCKLSEEQKNLYKDYINSAEVASMLAGRMKVFPGLIKLRKISNHPDLAFLESNSTPKKDSADQQKNNTSQFRPSHYEMEGGYGHWRRAGKMLVVESLLKMWKEKQHRVLLFTQSKQMLNILETFVQSQEYTYLRMDGETNIGSRQTLVKKFNEDKTIFIFLLTTRVGGLGLNLIGADRIIIYDPDWNPSTDSQARERSWRIGQEKNVTIYRLMTTGTIEEKIYHRQIFKQFLTNRVLSNPFQRRFFKSNDLYELFSLDDIGPQQTTETSAIFAGTGSEIKLRKKLHKVSKTQTDKEKDKSTQRTESEHTSTCGDSLSTNSLTEQILTTRHKQQSNDIMRHGRERHTTPKSKKKKRSKRKKRVRIDGSIVTNVEKVENYTKDDEQENELEVNEKKDEDDILLSLFQSSDIHSALKHDRIEQAGNPDYVLVEKEAERVAKKAMKALRESRAQCRANRFSVPTWTGNNSSTGASTNQPKKRRFGRQTGTSSSTDKTVTSELSTNSNDLNTAFDLENNSVDVSSSALLARMRRRNAGSASASSQETTTSSQAEENVLIKDIEQYMLSKVDRAADSDEIISFFKPRLQTGQNALFKELLKQICTFERHGSSRKWILKEEFRT